MIVSTTLTPSTRFGLKIYVDFIVEIKALSRRNDEKLFTYKLRVIQIVRRVCEVESFQREWILGYSLVAASKVVPAKKSKRCDDCRTINHWQLNHH